ncbi:hypothetical protein NF867_14640 [Solitalea sp. MAHUQ-68]|uniref:Uncharacterized protein n=1 Tax=Solitalea agri TaxID=2953739 RepID=A0A9X2JDF7_9SPHI|nr:hypothetical protein [Solitalea agri]MCO4294098.1 hypothetical protein [Solitalea agri]
MDDFMIAIVLLLVTTFISRTISEKATKKLDQIKKAELIDLFSNGRIYAFGILIGIVVLFFLSTKFNLLDPLIAYIIYIVSILVFLIVTSIISYRKLKANDFPGTYIKSYLLSTSLRFIGFVIFFTMIKY